MGLADTVTKAYMKDNSVFADAFNYLIYGGEAVVDPKQLQELDTTEIALPFGSQDEDGKQPEEAVQKYRDVLKSAIIKQDDEAAYILLGIENQTDIHYAMPVRNIIYDALQYGKQVADIAAKHRASDGDAKGHSRGEYLSGFYKEDKITPVITLVLHFGANEWDGPLSLHEMMAVKNKNLLNFVQDYQIHLIDPAKLSAEDLERFSSSLREVIGYIKYSKDKKRLSEFLTDNPRMLIEANAARVIKAVTNTPLDIPEGAEVIDVCKAVEEMMNESEERGELRMLVKQVRKGRITIEQAAEDANMSVEQFKRVMDDTPLQAVRQILYRADKPHKAQIGSQNRLKALWGLFFCAFSNLFVKKVVQDLTSAGIDWQREKWQSGLGSKFIHQGEKNAAKYADEVIVLSKGVQDYFKETYGRETHFIPNGVNRPQIREASLITDKFGLKKDSYILFLGRLVPEKGIRYLVEAFKNVKTDKKLVIAGGSSDTDSFMEELKELAKGDDRILFTGFVQGAMLDELYSNAYIYTLPSDLEGMPLSLLEAMSYGNCCLVSDIPECAEVVEDKALIFKKSDVEDLQEKLQDACDNPEMVMRMKNQAADFICEKYNWDEVARETMKLYRRK